MLSTIILISLCKDRWGGFALIY